MKELVKSISKKEWWFVAILSLAVICITTAPVVYGWLAAPAGHVFTGMHFVSADDWFVYYSFINQGKAGNFLFADLFSSIPHVKVFRPEWLAVGLLARLFNLSALVAFNLARIVLIPVFFVIAYIFIAYFFSKEFERKMATVFLAFSSGLGIFLIYRLAQNPLNYSDGAFQWPMDLWVPDINTFLTLFTSPHFIVATILILLIFLLTVLFSEVNKYSYAVLAGFSGLALFLIHPFQVLKVFVIIGLFFIFLILKQKKIAWPLVFYGAIFTAISAPAIFYYLWLLRFDWLTTLRAMQNINPTTPVYLTIISFGGLFFFASAGIYFLAKNKKISENKYVFLVIWAVGQLVLLYAPVNYQRRLALGVHFPLVILTVMALFYLYRLWPALIKKRIALIIVVGFLIFLPSTFFALAVDVMVFSQARELSYLDHNTNNAFLWLKQNTASNSVIFSDVKTGNVLPAYALRTSYVGHAVETPFYNQRKKEPIWFFSHNRSEAIEKSFLQNRGINYLFYGPLEKQLGSYLPDNKSYLKKVYSNAEISIYQVL